MTTSDALPRPCQVALPNRFAEPRFLAAVFHSRIKLRLGIFARNVGINRPIKHFERVGKTFCMSRRIIGVSARLGKIRGGAMRFRVGAIPIAIAQEIGLLRCPTRRCARCHRFPPECCSFVQPRLGKPPDCRACRCQSSKGYWQNPPSPPRKTPFRTG